MKLQYFGKHCTEFLGLKDFYNITTTIIKKKRIIKEEFLKSKITKLKNKKIQ